MNSRPVAVTRALLKRWPLIDPRETEGKEERGSALVIAGSRTVAGAAVLAATAVLRAGAGKVQIATVATSASNMTLAMPEAKVVGLAEDHDGEIRVFGRSVLADAAIADAMLIGPGMRTSAWMVRKVAKLLSTGARPVVLDAGALPACQCKHLCPVILTPHAGEMAALLGIDREEVVDNPLAVARSVAQEYDAFVALKGAATYIVSPEGQAWIHTGGSPGLGTSGSGDVLAGVVTGLLARGAAPDQAVVWAVWLHAQAGLRLSRRVGLVGFLAREIAKEIPALLTL